MAHKELQNNRNFR